MRRMFLAAFLSAAAIASFGAAKAEPVRIGLMAVLSGPPAALGQQVRDGFELGLAQLGGKLGGQPVELTVVDDELKPDVAVNKARGLLERDRVHFVVGPVFSNILAAIYRPVTEGGPILISPNAGPSPFAGKNCSPNFFATSYQNDQVHSVMGKVAQDKGYKRVFVIAPNYQAGKDAMAGFKRFYRGEVVEEAFVPLSQMDFQSELAKIAAAKPDAVFAFMPGGLGVALVKQYRQAGLANIPFLSTFTVDESTLPAQGEAALGFFSASDWAPNMDNPANRKFVAAFEAKYGHVPASYAAHAYDTVMLLDAAVRAVGGDLSDKAKVRAALEQAKFDSVRGGFRFGTNHFPVQDFWLVEVARRPDGKFQTETRQRVFQNDVDAYAAECRMN
jgi:branched-chain amino acid transport system substrate-binding protein